MANGNIADQLEAWLKDVHKLVPNEAEQERITKAGAKKLADNLTEVTRKKHYSSHKDEKCCWHDRPDLNQSLVIA